MAFLFTVAKIRGVRLSPITVFAALCLVTANAAAACQPSEYIAVGESDVWGTAQLGDDDGAALISMLGETAFDEPADWQTEIRLRRIALGDKRVIVVRGSNLLCGATGNCQTWIVANEGGRWRSLLPEPMIIASQVRSTGECNAGMPDLEIAANFSGGIWSVSTFMFDGVIYRESRSVVQQLP